MGSPFGGVKAGKVPKPSATEKVLEQAILPILLSTLYEKPEDILSTITTTPQKALTQPLSRADFLKQRGEEVKRIHEETGKPIDQIYREYRQSLKPELKPTEGKGTFIDLIKSGNIFTKFKETIDEIEKMIAGMSEREKEELAPIIEDYERYKKSLEPGLKPVPLSLGGRYIGSAFPARRANFLRLLLGQEAKTIAQPYNRFCLLYTSPSPRD